MTKTGFALAAAVFAAAYAPPPAAAQQGQSAVIIDSFLSVCPSYRGLAADGPAIMERKGVEALPLPANTPFLQGRDGAAWMLSPSHGRAVLVLTERGPCSLFVRRLETADFVADLSRAFEQIAPFALTADAPSREGPNGLKQHSFRLEPAGDYRARLESEGKSVAARSRIVLSETHAEDVAYQLAVTFAPILD